MSCGFSPLHAIMAIGTVLIMAFDSATNWYAFTMYMKAKTDYLTDNTMSILIGCAATFGTLLWVLAIRNMVYACKAWGADDPAGEQESVGRWEESTSFFQLILQDSAMALIVYFTFRLASCTLYQELFQNSITPTLALIGALSGSVWKIVRGTIDCICCCFTKADTGCGWACLCCSCRIVSSLVSTGIIGFIAYQLIIYKGIVAFENRSDCTTTG
ncbi:hypothetical protein LSH36_1249g00042 [Paralvinella palmiformis]|uniref:Uncharacterized protein n=1 Tax=Paralvinella palmiformis TaxID=53620 RepID=A0AAD9ITX1_9ANNE|nr:hypothetical protein LSH36_1249g00042 [Paralvinella palmiformis]